MLHMLQLKLIYIYIYIYQEKENCAPRSGDSRAQAVGLTHFSDGLSTHKTKNQMFTKIGVTRPPHLVLEREVQACYTAHK